MSSGHDHDHDHGHDHAACDSESAGLATDASRIEALISEGVHRIGENEGPFSLHVLGLGEAGADIVKTMIKAHSGNGVAAATTTKFNALAIDLDDAPLAAVRQAASGAPGGRVTVDTAAVPVLSNADLFTQLRRYREFLKNEFPRYYWNPNTEAWLPSDIAIPAPGEHFPRSISKALYGVDYYTDGVVKTALDRFADGVLNSSETPLVVVAFSIAGGTGSGMVVELARHLSNIRLGRRALVLGLGILPAEADPAEYADGRNFITINELDCMVDPDKNNGVMAVWGDLYKNPFTAGFFAVPQDAVVRASGGLEAAHTAIDGGIADFVLTDGGTHLYESIKALNWLNVPASAWHPATRGDQSDRWINLLSVGTLPGEPLLADELVDGVNPEFTEVRVFGGDQATADQAAKSLSASVQSQVGPNVVAVDSSSDGVGVSGFVARVSKLDLAFFAPARDAYDTLEWEEKLLRHAWLLDLGVLLCEPSTRFEGVGGECIFGCACWVVVPHAAIRGELDLVAG